MRPCSPIDDLHVVYTTTDSIVIAWTDSTSAWIDSTSSSDPESAHVPVGNTYYIEYDTVDFTPGTGSRTPFSVFLSPFSVLRFLPLPTGTYLLRITSETAPPLLKKLILK